LYKAQWWRRAKKEREKLNQAKISVRASAAARRKGRKMRRIARPNGMERNVQEDIAETHRDRESENAEEREKTKRKTESRRKEIKQISQTHP